MRTWDTLVEMNFFIFIICNSNVLLPFTKLVLLVFSSLSLPRCSFEPWCHLVHTSVSSRRLRTFSSTHVKVPFSLLLFPEASLYTL